MFSFGLSLHAPGEHLNATLRLAFEKPISSSSFSEQLLFLRGATLGVGACRPLSFTSRKTLIEMRVDIFYQT